MGVNDIGTRFKEIISFLKSGGKIRNNRQLASELGISPQGITEITSGRAKPNSKVLDTLHSRYHINKEWLWSGEGEMLIQIKEGNYHEGDSLRRYLTEYGFDKRTIAGILKIPVEDVDKQLNKSQVEGTFRTELYKKLHLPLGTILDIRDPNRNEPDAFFKDDRNQHWGNAIKDWFRTFEISFQHFTEMTSYTEEEIDQILSNQTVSEEFIVEILALYPEIAIGHWRLNNFPIPSNFKFDITNRFGHIQYIDVDHIHVKLVTRDLQLLYNRKLVNTVKGDARFIELMPDMLIPDPDANKSYGRNFMVFELVGDNMDNGCNNSLLDLDKILTVELSKKKLKLLAKEGGHVFVLITSEGPKFTELSFKGENQDLLICHSRNPNYSDYSLSIGEIKQFFCVLKIVERDLAPSVKE